MQKYGGISRYFAELMKNISPEYDLALKFSDNIYLRQITYPGKSLRLPERFKGKSTLLFHLNKPLSIKKIKEKKFDLFHPTYYDPYFLKYIGGRPFVLTVHDMTHELFPDKVNRMDRSAEYKKIVAGKAAKIICVSENTRRDFCRLLNIDENKTEVIYHGSSLKMSSAKYSISLPEKYILYVGTRGYYKNFNVLYTAVEPLLKADKNLYLLCAGGGNFSREEMLKFEAAGLSDKVLYKQVSDNILPFIYNNAQVFVFPSLYEGFGIPVLEAFNCDCPVITSNLSSLPEVAGDAAYYVSPHEPSMIREAVAKFVYDPAIREKFIIKGRNRRELFSWEKTARQTMHLYQSINS